MQETRLSGRISYKQYQSELYPKNAQNLAEIADPYEFGVALARNSSNKIFKNR